MSTIYGQTNLLEIYNTVAKIISKLELGSEQDWTSSTQAEAKFVMQCKWVPAEPNSYRIKFYSDLSHIKAFALAWVELVHDSEWVGQLFS